MISTAAIPACFTTLFVSLILPVLILIGYCVKKKGQGVFSAWLLGAAGFFVTQMMIRLPLLNILSASSGFLAFALAHPFLYYLFLAFTAGLFELAGRFAAAKCMGKKLTCQRALAAGLGHGGIEAMLLVGLTYVNNLIYLFMIRSGSFDALIAQAAAAGADTSQLTLLRDSLLQTSGSLFLLAGLERLLTMIVQAAMSVIVCYAVHTRRTVPGLLICLGIHTFLDLSTFLAALSTESMGSVLSQTTAYGIVYTLLTILALVSLLVLKNIRARWNTAPQEVAYDSPQ